MSFWNTLKKHAGAQFLDVIEWLDDSNDTLVYRFPVFNQAITDNSKLVVREGQAAVFVSEGKLSDVFPPGTYTLDTRNAPILSFFESIKYQLNYPYKGDVYFISTRQFMDNGWGTANPIMMRDAEFGPVRIRAFGSYSYRIAEPTTFMRQVVGTDGLFTTDEINGQLKKKLVSMLADTIGKARIPVLDLAANYMDFADTLSERINPVFMESYGVGLTDFTIGNISLPAEVEKALDTRTKMGVLGDLNAYTQLKAADAIDTAARNPGMGGAAIGMGVGFGMGNQMGAMMGQSMQGGGGPFNPHQGMQGPPSPAPPPPPMAATFHYHGASGQSELDAAAIASHVAADRTGKHMLWQAGWPGWKAWSDVPEVASLVPPAPAAPPPLPGAQTFHYNGPSGRAELPLADLVAAVRAAPGQAHHVWQTGWPAWKKAEEVPEIAAQLGGDGPPPLPPPM
ncbi:MAG: membrane protease subunit (stomatin/prohibitin family) [Myxococcota bacterium]|jgi:membrane protease subunit (stomatin/prohibitin family)